MSTARESKTKKYSDHSGRTQCPSGHGHFELRAGAGFFSYIRTFVSARAGRSTRPPTFRASAWANSGAAAGAERRACFFRPDRGASAWPALPVASGPGRLPGFRPPG